MTKIYSYYRLFGGFGLLLMINLAIGFGVYKLLVAGPDIHLFQPETWDTPADRKVVAGGLAFQLLFLTLFGTQSKFIIIRHDRITFINLLLPFLWVSRRWSAYDYCVTVDEHSRYGTHEALWLIKNGHLRDRISSFYYINYDELERGIAIRHQGRLEVGSFRQLACLLGARVP